MDDSIETSKRDKNGSSSSQALQTAVLVLVRWIIEQTQQNTPEPNCREPDKKDLFQIEDNDARE